VKKPTPKPIRERAWVLRMDNGQYLRDGADGGLTTYGSANPEDAQPGDTMVEVEIRSVPRKARKRARRKA